MKNVFNKLLNWILYTSTFAACCAVGLCMATEHLLVGETTRLWSPLHILIFGGVLVVYNTHFVLKKSTPELSDRFGWSQHYKFWHYLIILSGVALISVNLFSLTREIIVACIILSVLSFAYSIPLLPLANKKRLRDYGWVKIILLTSVWTIVTAVFPILINNKEVSDYPFEILIRFTFLFSLCLAFDIRDMQTDTGDGIATVPGIIGVKRSYQVIDCSLVLFMIFSIIQYIRYLVPSRLMAEIATVMITKMIMMYTKRNASDRVYLGMVDGVMLFYSLLILVN